MIFDKINESSDSDVKFGHLNVAELRRILNEDSFGKDGSQHHYTTKEAEVILNFFNSVIKPINKINDHEND